MARKVDNGVGDGRMVEMTAEGVGDGHELRFVGIREKGRV